MSTHDTPAARSHTRRGTIYVLVLSIAGLLAAIAVGAGAYTTAETRRAREMEASGVATAAAQSALEATVGMIQADRTGEDWKPRAGLAGFDDRRSLGDAAVSVGVSSSDGTTPLTDWSGSVYIEAVAWHRGWEHRLRATLEPVVANLAALGHPLVVGGNITVTGTTLAGQGVAITNGAIEGISAQVGLEVHAATATGSTFAITPTIRTEPIALPDPSIISAYVARATVIEISQLAGRTMQNVVLSSGRNPYGATNASGIYAIRCNGQNVKIRNVRVVGTLILINAGSGSEIADRVFFEQAATNQPVLLVDGSIQIQTESNDLSEASIATNLNSTGAPFRGATDSDTTDFYPSIFEGIVYVSGNVASSGSTTIEGSLIVGGTVTITGPVSVRPFAPAALVDGMTEVARWRLLGIERLTR